MVLNSTIMGILETLSSTPGLEIDDHHDEDHDDHLVNDHDHGHFHDLHEAHIENTFTEVVLMFLCLTCVSVMGFVLNFLLIAAILFTKKLRKATGLLIISVSSNDLFLCLFVYPILAYGTFKSEMVYDEGWCKVSAVSLQICTYVRICTFPIVAFNRYQSLTRRMADLKQRKLIAMVILSWGFPMSVIIIPILLFENVHIEYSFTYDACIIHDLLDYFSEAQFCLFLVCFLITCLLYIKILKHLKFEVTSADRAAPPTLFQIQQRKVRAQFNRMMALVSAAFFICIFPYLCFRMVDKKLDIIHYRVHKLSLVLLVLCSLFNPVTLIFTNKWHKLVIMKIVCLKSPNKVIPQNVNIS